jgi:DNA-binding CsgD family transcriptional regulator
MEELKSIIRFAMGGAQSATPSQQVASLTDGSVLRMMTSKQHAAMQMWLFSGMKIADMARRMNCSRNTARLHVKALWTKMGTEDKDEISRRLMPILDEVSDADYMEWSGGLPKNWAATYDGGRIDPYLSLYVKSKENTYERGKT